MCFVLLTQIHSYIVLKFQFFVLELDIQSIIFVNHYGPELMWIRFKARWEYNFKLSLPFLTNLFSRNKSSWSLKKRKLTHYLYRQVFILYDHMLCLVFHCNSAWRFVRDIFECCITLEDSSKTYLIYFLGIIMNRLSVFAF